MSRDSIYSSRQYLKKIINTFVPAFFFGLSPVKNRASRHWSEQNCGDVHGYNNYCMYQPRIPVLINELSTRVTKQKSILDLGCNCGFYLYNLKKEGYEHLAGVDISKNAIEYGKKNFDMQGIDLIIGGFEQTLPEIHAKNIQYDLVYSMGATIELVHPSFDIVKYICLCANEYVILNIYEWGHAYPRFWEYEFNRHGFFMVKCIRPYNGAELDKSIENIDSFLVFRRIKGGN